MAIPRSHPNGEKPKGLPIPGRDIPIPDNVVSPQPKKSQEPEVELSSTPESSPSIAQSDEIECWSCGALREVSYKFCPKCGAPNASPESEDKTPDTSPIAPTEPIIPPTPPIPEPPQKSSIPEAVSSSLSENIYDDDEDPFDFDDDDDWMVDDLDDDADEKYEDDLDDEEEEELEPTPNQQSSRPERPKPVRPGETPTEKRPRPPNKKNKKDLPAGYTEDTFIDEEKVKLKPFGRLKRKAKVSEFDNRKNLRQRAKIVQMSVIGFLVILVGLGVKNAIIPPSTLSVDEVQAIVDSSSADTGFPLEEGGAFAKDFMITYLTIDNSSEQMNRMLGYFYTGSMSPYSGDTPTRIPSSTRIKQTIKSGPTIYESTYLSSKSANYTIGAFVESESTEPEEGLDGELKVSDDEDPAAADDAKWAFFSVNVYYDPEEETFAIDPESPTVVAPINIEGTGNIPPAEKLGTGKPDETLTKEVRSVIMGFLKGFAVSSVDDHSEVDQYVISDPSPSLLEGFDGRFTIEEDQNISFSAFPTEFENEVKVEARVNWTDTISGNENIQYVSTYIITLQKNGDHFLVSKFAPKLYFPKDTN